MVRRQLLKLTTAGATGLFLGPGAEANEVDLRGYETLVPTDKNLDADWLRSLYERGEAEVCTANQLEYIGMPVGGLACGTLYLGGDGKLWHWEIFSSIYQSDYTDKEVWRGHQYERPWQQQSPIEQGFAISVTTDDGHRASRRLDKRDFSDIRFRGEYPVGRVGYEAEGFPVSVNLEAFSPFIPLNAEDSALPATIMRYKVENTSSRPIDVVLAGWLQNAVCLEHEAAPGRVRKNRVDQSPGRVSLVSTAQADEHGGVGNLNDAPGYGSLALSVLGDGNSEQVAVSLDKIDNALTVVECLEPLDRNATALRAFDQPLMGAIGQSKTLMPGEQYTFTFVLSWWFPFYPNVHGEMAKIQDIQNLRRHYARRFPSAEAVAEYVCRDFDRLSRQTLLWNKTWYGSTLPYWFLDRCFIPLDCVATQTVHWFDNGRVYGWEGTNCCPGTCQHVWNYAQGLARVFPQIERSLRETVDYGIAYHPTGELGYRAEHAQHIAHDGQCGTILRMYREHQMSSDDNFLRNHWQKIRRSIEYLIGEDGDDNGLLEGKQMNTLDAAWYGPMGWISSLYLAVLAAGQAMAREMSDDEFAKRCGRILDVGRKNIVQHLFNGEYFIHKVDPDHTQAINTNDGCEIDQIMGHNMAFQFGLNRILPKKQAVSALRSLWRYNFTPDAGNYREKMHSTIAGGRVYSLPGEAGLVMCTWPKGGAENAAGSGNRDVFVGYFNETMTGFEYGVAAGMLWEGLVKEGLAVTRAIHDRYHPSKRNPYNEVECSSHYSRAMMSYGVYLAAGGYEYHGPRGHLGFAPRLHPENFRCAFTASEGWGSYNQKYEADKLTANFEIAWGRVELTSLAFEMPHGLRATRIEIFNGDEPIKSSFQQTEHRVEVQLSGRHVVASGKVLAVAIHA